MNVTARILYVFEKTRMKCNYVTRLNLIKSEKYWLRQSMILTSKAYKKGDLNSLRPKLNEDGVIVLASRAVKGLELNYDRDSFPILVYKDPLSYLWIKEVHDEDHSGITRTVAKSRRKFWIVKARRLAQKVKNSCYKCRLLDKKMESQQMAPLPDFRLKPAPVFNCISIDLFGPILIKDAVKKRVHMKTWGFIATCAATRAVHLDVTDSYGTDSILQTLRKFIALRGCPGEIISDQGSQLMAASKDIAELTANWDWKPVNEWAETSKIKWTVVPAEAHHMNGLSESLIRSVKRTIQHTIGENVLTISELQLAFFEIANILNSRPLGIVEGSDPDDPKPLTPNHLLLGRSTNEVPQGPFDTKPSLTKRFRFVQSIVDAWWSKWSVIVLPSLVPSYKWQQKHRCVKVGDVCLIRYKAIRATYRLGRVVDVIRSKDDLVHKVRLAYKLPGETKFRHVDRAVQGIAVIVPVDEQ